MPIDKKEDKKEAEKNKRKQLHEQIDKDRNSLKLNTFKPKKAKNRNTNNSERTPRPGNR